MGYYINSNSKGLPLPATGKAKELIADGGTLTNVEFQDDLVCVVENGFFDAAAYIYSPSEMEEFKRADGRRKHWLIHPKAKELSGYAATHS